MSTYEIWTIILTSFSSVAACITAGSVFAAFLTYRKNILSERSFTADFTFKGEEHSWNYTYLHAIVCFINKTNKNFFLPYCCLCFNGEEFPMLYVAEKFHGATNRTEQATDLPITARASRTTSVCFKVPIFTDLPETAVFKVVSTFDTYHYTVSLRVNDQSDRTNK